MGPDRIKPMPPGYQPTIWPMSDEAKERVRAAFEKMRAGTPPVLVYDPLWGTRTAL